MASMRPRLPPADTEAGDRHNVLSIDGGGVRGMIPARVLDFLEQKLNDLDPTANGDARIADYFDLIAGTSTGGILTSLLATPDQDGHLRSVDKICNAYLADAGQIFPQQNQSQEADTVPAMKEKDEEPTPDHPFDIPDLIWKILPETLKKLLILLNALKGPMYDGQALRKLAAQHFQDKKISETATEIFLTSFDINNRHPIHFSTYQGRTDPTRDVLVKDACISTSAAPVYLPPYYFTDQGIEYNAIDGGIAANNPAMACLMSLVYQNYTSQNTTIEDLIRDIQRKKQNGPPFPVQMLSLGCGEGERISYSAQENWPAWQWMFYPSTRESPLLNFLMEAGPDMVHVQTQLVFQFLNGASYPNGYLRVQEYNLPDENAAIDNGSPENMNELGQIAAQLIKENAKTVNPITGEIEDMYDSSGNVITNEEALEQFAMSLVNERNKRLDRAMSKAKK